MKKVAIIKADTNDADYITSEYDLDDELEQLILKVASILKQGHNWETSDYARGDSPEVMYKDILTPDEIDMFNSIVPYGEYGIHTIKSIRIITIAEDKRVF